MLRISILGPFEVERNGQTIAPSEWARPKDRALLKLLALDGGRLAPQDRLLDLLWPDLSPKAAANSLHVSISRLRKVLSSPVADADSAPSSVLRQGVGYTLSSHAGLWVDLAEFQRLLEQGRKHYRSGVWVPAAQALRSALALYRGDLFEDDPYEEWAMQPREHLRQAYFALVEDLAACSLQLGAPAEAVAVCERALVRERTREALYVQLLRAHLAAGHVAEALHAYERCRQALDEDLGIEPGAAVQAVYAQALSGDVTVFQPINRSNAPEIPEAPGVSAAARTFAFRAENWSLPWAGRNDEMGVLTASLARARSSHGQLLFVHGEPGIGKSRLLDEFAGFALARGARVLTARCYEMERDLPYAPVAEALSPFLREQASPTDVTAALGQWGPHLVTLLPPLRKVLPDLPPSQALRPDAERAAVLAGLTHLLLSFASHTCLILLLDDLQWADESTVQWLHYLARRLSSERVLIVGTYRTSELSPEHPLQRLLGSLAGDPVAPNMIELSCLTEDEVAALLPAIYGSAARGRALANQLHRKTDGHPLFLIETLRTLLETGILHLDDAGNWTEGQPAGTDEPDRYSDERLPIPTTVREAILWRVRRLKDPIRRLLGAAAVAGRSFTPDLLGRMTDLEPEVVLDGVETLTERQFLKKAAFQSGFDFRHDVIQEVIYGDLGADRQRLLHTRAAEALEAIGAARPDGVQEIAGKLAYHWRLAERWPEAFRYALLAGDRARDASAPREALTHYLRAEEAADRCFGRIDAQQRVALLQRLGRAHADSGAFDAAIQHFQAVHALSQDMGDRLLEGRALVAESDAEFMRHNFQRAKHLASEAAALAENLGDRELLVGTRISAANVAIALGYTDDAARHCNAVLALAGTQAPEPGQVEPGIAGARLSALGWLGLLWQWQGDHERATPAIEASLRLGQELHNPFLTGRSRFALTMALGNRGRYEEALTGVKEALRLADEAGDRYFLPRLLNTAGWLYSELGDLRQAEEWNQQSIFVARETGWLEAEANALVNVGMDAVHGGNGGVAHEVFGQAATLIERDEWFTWRYRIRLQIGLAELALLDGNPERALDHARQARALAKPTGSRKHVGRAWLITGRAMQAAGASPEQVLPPIERAHTVAQAIEHPPLLWASGTALARLYSQLGREADAAACWAENRASVEAVSASIHDPTLQRSLRLRPVVQEAIAGR